MENINILQTETIELACWLVDKTYGTIKRKLQGGRRSCAVINKVIDEDEILVEIRLYRVTLTCSFNTDDVCECVYLFFDRSRDVSRYLLYLNQHYLSAGSVWLINGRSIRLEVQRKELYFTIT